MRMLSRGGEEKAIYQQQRKNNSKKEHTHFSNFTLQPSPYLEILPFQSIELLRSPLLKQLKTSSHVFLRSEELADK